MNAEIEEWDLRAYERERERGREGVCLCVFGGWGVGFVVTFFASDSTAF